MVQDGDGDEAREPEEHGQGVETEHGHGVGEGGEEARRQGQVDEDQECPDGDEDHEAVLGGGVAVGCDWGGVSWALTAETKGGGVEEMEVGGCVPWAVSPRTMMAKRACTARSAMIIMSSMLVKKGYCRARDM